jgi:hypothetical protein
MKDPNQKMPLNFLCFLGTLRQWIMGACKRFQAMLRHVDGAEMLRTENSGGHRNRIIG